MSLVLLHMNVLKEKPTKNYLIVPSEHATTAFVNALFSSNGN